MSSKNQLFSVTENISHAPVRATYIPTADGLKLLRISEFNDRKFKTSKFYERSTASLVEAVENSEISPEDFAYIPDCYLSGIEREISEKAENNPLFQRLNQLRAQRRAKLRAYDAILCNPDLDLFATFTFDPSMVNDAKNYSDVYKPLKIWLSNRVSREGLKYVIAPERHKKGGIHFHMLCNDEAMKKTEALSPYNGKPLLHNGKPLYNISDWRFGFTSAESVSGEDANTKVAKYIFKYMTKEEGKIGGRYLLMGGDLQKPVYAYGEDMEEFTTEEPKFKKHVEIGDNIIYNEWSFV